MSLGLKYKNNEQIFVERQRGGVPYLSILRCCIYISSNSKTTLTTSV